MAPSERVGMHDAMRMSTIDVACHLGMENKTGSSKVSLAR
jgi:hypothetical protein